MIFYPLSKIDGNHIGSVVNRVLSGMMEVAREGNWGVIWGGGGVN